MSENVITVMGLGNILLSDEGFGVHFISWFEGRYRFPENVQLIDGGTLGLGLLDIVTSSEKLIVIDVIKTDDEPGSLYRFTKEEMETYLPEPTSAHEVEFVDVLIQADLMGQCPEVVFLCIVPKSYGKMYVGMTPLMTEKFQAMEELLLKELASFDASPQRI